MKYKFTQVGILLNKLSTWILVAVLLATGFYGMLALWSEFGGNRETEEIGIWLSAFGWGGATLVAAVQLWRTYSSEIIDYATGAMQAVRGKARKVKRKSRANHAYEEIMKLKELRDAEVITEQEFRTKSQKLKKDIV